ncbi:WXG100 family type VII secretion target [Nocardioides sp.]|uniref:WXG100 family type VII secretion target n=1 Tax=Nocardioides sp. TaxID=35761 RepID=UPI0035B4AD26
MTTYEVDLDEVRQALAGLAGCQRELISLAGDVEAAQARLQDGWSGRASDAQATSYAAWRDECAGMVTALAALRGVAARADAHYSHAVATNVDLWRQVAP